MRLWQINREGKIKLFFSLSLLLYSILVSIITKNFAAFLAMLFSSMGDICIMASRGVFCEEKRNSFKLGVASFAFAHLVYVAGMKHEHTIAFISIAMVALVMVIYLSVTKNNNSNFVPYAICLLTSAVNSWFFSWVAGIGMILFLLSDAILSICEEKSPKWQITIWATYVPAQVFLLTAILIA